MITVLPAHWFTQPSYEDYQIFTSDRTIPWRMRAYLISLYRKLARRPSKLARGKPEKEVLVFKPRPSPSLRAAPRYKRKPRQEPGSSKKNFRRVVGLYPVIRWTSGGRGRPSRRRKIQFRTIVQTIHLKGNKYNGGFRVF